MEVEVCAFTTYVSIVPDLRPSPQSHLCVNHGSISCSKTQKIHISVEASTGAPRPMEVEEPVAVRDGDVATGSCGNASERVRGGASGWVDLWTKNEREREEAAGDFDFSATADAPIDHLLLAAGFTGTTISARRAHMDGICLVNKKRRLTLRPCVGEVDHSSKRDIVSRIISQLTLKEAVVMSSTSTKLRRAWIYHPNLYFDTSIVFASSDRHKRVPSTETFIDRVNFILRTHSGLGVNKLAVMFELRKEHAHDIDGYQRGVAVWRAAGLQLPSPPGFCGFANLTVLTLENVLVLGNLQLLLKCSALEWLTIRMCSQLHNLYAPEPLPRLAFLCVQDCAIDKIDVHAPNLTTFKYRGRFKPKTASIASPIEDNLYYIFTELPNGLPHVERLHVNVFVKTQIPGFTQAPHKFINLRHLTMRITYEIAKRFGRNAVLQLAYFLEAAPFLVDLHLDSLKRACITGFNGNGGQVALVKFILRNAVKLEEMVIDPKGRITNQMMGEHKGRRMIKEKLVPKDKNGLLGRVILV
uniref:At1g61320/AtMIF1 LRR domain-containing protein n=1 Tax=Oryza nivara TaxID=4536 RepID=A0A0E0HZG1_ORYNI